jgi:hypothetical protein
MATLGLRLRRLEARQQAGANAPVPDRVPAGGASQPVLAAVSTPALS